MVYKRRSIRLSKYDYSTPGYYFITICVDIRRGGSRTALTPNHNIFGHVKNRKMILNNIGQIVHNSWIWLAKQYNYVNLDKFIVMPNHFHGLIFINAMQKGGSRTAPTYFKIKPLGRLIGAFKTISTKHINIFRNTPRARLWQRNYYDRVIRDEFELNRTREYIMYNPINWADDEYNVLGFEQ